MNKRSKKVKFKVFHFLYISFVFSLMFLFHQILNLDLSILSQLVFVTITSTLVNFFLLNPFIFLGLLFLGSLASLLINHYITPFVPTFIHRLDLLFYNIANNLQKKEAITPDNAFLFFTLLLLLLSLFTAIVLFKNKSIFWLLPVYIGFFVYYWYLHIDEAYWMFALFLLGFFILIGLDRGQYARSNKIITKTVITYSLLIVFISISLPKINNYIQSSWLDEKIYSIFPQIKDLRSHNQAIESGEDAILFNFCNTGFQEAGCNLGGPVNLSKKKIMTVYADSPTYLRGHISHIYRGNSWCAKQVPWESHLTNEKFKDPVNGDLDIYLEKSHIEIINETSAFTTLFTPYGSDRISISGKYPLHKSIDDILILKRGIYSGENYQVEFYNSLPYKEAVSLGANMKKEDLDSLPLYLQIPEEKISQRTKDLVESIVRNQEGDFEKAIAIESYLRKNYKYSLDVDPIPPNHEFIDYFLFEEEKGYCTYFATTMAVMLRLEGIPSRYVEGYLAHDLVEDGVYEVKQNNAHAWVEAFIEPIGWMTFEATPYMPISESRLEEDIIVAENLDMETEVIRENNLDRIIEEAPRYEEEGLLEENGLSYRPSEDLSVDSSNITTGAVLLFLLLLVFIRFLFSILRHKYIKYQARKLSKGDYMIYLYQEILNTMDLLGCPQHSGETHFEYANRIAYKFSRFQGKGIVEITDIFVKTKYGGKDISYDELRDLEVYLVSLDNNFKNKLGKIKYFYHKYIKIIR